MHDEHKKLLLEIEAERKLIWSKKTELNNKEEEEDNKKIYTKRMTHKEHLNMIYTTNIP